MASLIAVQTMSRNAKKLILDFSFLNYSQNKNMEKIGLFTDFLPLRIMIISGLEIGRANPKEPLHRFI